MKLHTRPGKESRCEFCGKTVHRITHGYRLTRRNGEPVNRLVYADLYYNHEARARHTCDPGAAERHLEEMEKGR